MGKPPHPALYDGSMERNRGGRPRHPDVLTPAEWRVLEALREGGTNAEIAARLGVSANTVRYHVSNMLAKLELRDRRALAAWRPEGRRRRLGALLALPAALWSVGRPLAWVGVGAAALAGVAVVVVALVALEVIVEGDPDPPAAVAPPSATPTSTPTVSPTATPAPTPTAALMATPTPTAAPDPTETPAPSPMPTPTATPAATPTAIPAATASQPASPQSRVPAHPRVPPSPNFATPPGSYTAIAVGAEYLDGSTEHACALTESGQPVCWAIDDGSVWEAPRGSYSSITALDGNVCATTTAGVIECWAGDGGVLADHTPDPAGDVPPGRYTALSGEHGYYCALTEAGEPVCWGPEAGPLPLPELPPGTYTTISLGYSILEEAHLTACAISVAGNLLCWRAIDSDGVADAQSIEHIPGRYATAHVHGLEVCTVTAEGMASCGDWAGDESTRYRSLSRGAELVCAIADTGTIQCLEHDIRGFVGEWGTTALMSAPEPSAGRTYVAVSVGYMRACALTDVGEAVCWGSVDNKLASPDPAPGRYVAVTDGYGHTCALTDDGLAVCWGWNNFGQADVPAGRYAAISAGFASTCALTRAGEPVCWGALASRRGASLASHTFPEGGYRAISTGYEAACALTDQGSPVCVGDWGLAGAETPRGAFTEITVGWTGHACALSEDGDVACWGDWGRYSELDVLTGPWAAADAGDLQTCAIAADGDLVCWDARSVQATSVRADGHAAIETDGHVACVLTDAGRMLCGDAHDLVLRPVSEDLHISRISVGPNRRCAVTDAGAVVCWGDTEYMSRPVLARHGYQPRYP